MRRWCIAGVAAVLIVLGVSPHVSAVNTAQKNRGLYITPIRQYISVDPGKSYSGHVTVANLTEKPLDVTLSAEQFSVIDYSYDYNFTPAKEDWVKITTPTTQLDPGKSQDIAYQVAVPKTAEPGGHYFTLFASAVLPTGEKVRAATMLYATANGKLVKTSTIASESMSSVSFGGDIPFHLNVRSTGNTHFFIYTTGRLEGFSTQPEHTETAHILLPQTTRSLDGAISPPILPGIYNAVYGYKTDANQSVVHTKYILYVPLWSWTVLAGMIWLIVVLVKRQKRLHQKSKASE